MFVQIHEVLNEQYCILSKDSSVLAIGFVFKIRHIRAQGQNVIDCHGG